MSRTSFDETSNSYTALRHHLTETAPPQRFPNRSITKSQQNTDKKQLQ